MRSLPVLSAREVIAGLERAGFVYDRARGSHAVMVHEGRRRSAVVPMHGSRDISVPLLHRILKQAGLSADEFSRLLR